MIKKIPITPNPKGTCKSDYLDGSWLGLRFGGLLLPSIEDLPLECPTPVGGKYLDKTIAAIDIKYIKSQWYWVLTLL